MEHYQFLICICVIFLVGGVLFLRDGGRKKPEKPEKPEKGAKPHMEFTKVIMLAILGTYFLGFILGAWVVVTETKELGTSPQLGVLLAYLGTPVATAVGFYCWKAKAENCLRLQQKAPEGTTLGELASLSHL